MFTDTSIPIDDSAYLANLTPQDLEAINSNENLATLFGDGGIEKNFSNEELQQVFSKSNYDQSTLITKTDSLSRLLTIDKLKQLFGAGGMNGMLWTIYLIMCAMVFGGIMDAIGALSRITNALLSIATTVFGLFASTVISCLGLNIIASDQYLALVIPGKMFKKAYEDRGLAPENLSRTLEDSGTVTSVLIPWNTCGAYQSGVLGVGVSEYFIYAIFNWLSPFTTLLFAGFNIKIKQIKGEFK